MSDWMLKELKLRFDESCEIVEQQQQRIVALEQQLCNRIMALAWCQQNQ